MVCMNAKTVVEKFGERSYGFCKEVTVMALPEPRAMVNNATDTYGLLLENVIPAKQQAGIK